jgi:HEAT repeat protein
VAPILLKAVNDSNADVRMVAASALQRVDPKTADKDEVIQALIGILKNPDDQIAYRAPAVLGKLGNAASAAVPALIEAARGTNRLVSSAAASALKKIDPNAAKEAGVK